MHKYKLLIAVAAVLLLPGCLKSTFREEEPRLDVDRSEVTVRARSGTGSVKDTLYVSGNRSWSVVFAEETGWLSLGTEGFENPSGVLKTAPLVVICEENHADDPRSAALVILGGGEQKIVTVRQKGIQRVDEADSQGIDDYIFEDYGTN